MQRWKLYAVLHVLLAAFSLSPVCIKLAGRYPFLSGSFILYYGISIAILGVYALGWQQIIKRMPLTAAYANKAVTVVWGMIWGVALFGEVVTLQRALGAAVIIAGVLLYALSEPGADAGAAEDASGEVPGDV